MSDAVVELIPSDWAQLRALRLAAIADSADIYGDLVEEQEQPQQYWEQLLQEQTWLALVIDGQWVGLVCVIPSGPDRYGDYWLKSWWIDPTYRGRGGSKLMMNWLVDFVRTASGKVLALGVFDTNLDAIAAFTALGFESLGTRKPSTRPGAYYIIMSKEITLD